MTTEYCPDCQNRGTRYVEKQGKYSPISMEVYCGCIFGDRLRTIDEMKKHLEYEPHPIETMPFEEVLKIWGENMSRVELLRQEFEVGPKPNYKQSDSDY